MVLMALDHVRDFFHSGAMSFSPTDLARTTPALFLTRWITHFCLPVFMFTAGASAYLWQRRGGHGKTELARFLATRGLWFIALELTVMQFAYNFNLSWRIPILLLILWIFGVCMIAMAGLISLPVRWLLLLSLAIIAGHDSLDLISAASFGSAAWIWNLAHQPGIFVVAGKPVLATYTFLPWIGVMGAGFCFGRIFEWEPPARRRFMQSTGLFCIAAFFALRLINRYGDSVPWAAQKNALFTVLSFLNCTKYPASLDFLLMTLGPALVALAWLDRRPPRPANPFVIFGRVPFFYFVLHFYLIHACAVVLALLRYGAPAWRFVFNPPPSMGTPAAVFPPHYGYSLGTTYLIWIGIVALLYPLCRWYANLKARRRAWWLSYL